MSEQLPEEVEEPAAAADLEELLEQFREPEAVPKKRANPLWVVSALLLTLLACWLALQASRGGSGEKPKSAALVGERLPGKVSQRTVMRVAPVSVMEDYLARCKRGMSAREVRWIVEDFQKAGLGEEPPSGVPIPRLVSRRLAHDAWYLELLADGLKLNKDQRLIAAQKLGSLHSEALAALTEDIDGNEGHRTWGILKPFVDTWDWLGDERYAPWNLCPLTPEQEAVTRRAEGREEEERVAADQNGQDVVWTAPWLAVATPFRTRLTDTREIHVADGGFGPLAAAGSIFPLEEVQLFEGEDFIPLNDPTRLHPAQLKTLLLLEPERAAQILQALEKADD